MAEARWRGAVTIGDALARGRGRLAAAGCDTPRLDAELLLAEALGVGRERARARRGDAPLGADDARALRRRWSARRAAREPVAYILGRRGVPPARRWRSIRGC